jgi:hypothetical protein
MVCDDSHLLVVQTGNLGASSTSRAKKSLPPPWVERRGASLTLELDVAFASHVNLMVRHAYDAKVRGQDRNRAC